MKSTVQIVDETPIFTNLFSLLKQYKLLPQLQQKLTIDWSIAQIQCKSEEIVSASQQFAEKHQLISTEEQQAILLRSPRPLN